MFVEGQNLPFGALAVRAGKILTRTPAARLDGGLISQGRIQRNSAELEHYQLPASANPVNYLCSEPFF
jgi:hypothetical protein